MPWAAGPCRPRGQLPGLQVLGLGRVGWERRQDRYGKIPTQQSSVMAKSLGLEPAVWVRTSYSVI